MAYNGLIPESFINVLNRKRQLSALEAKLAGGYADPNEQWGMGNIIHELDPTYFVPRGVDTLRNLRAKPFSDAYLNLAYGRNDPMVNRAAGLETLNLIGGLADVSPLAMLSKPVKAGAKYLGREAARQIERNADALGLRNYVVKPEGGQWSDTTRKKLEKAFEERGVVTDWLNTAGKKYLLNRMGTPSDEIRMLLDKEISHLDPDKIRQLALDINQGDKDFIRAKRRIAGFPEEGMAESQAAKRWELMTDEFINPNPASVYQDPRFISEAPWATKLDPNVPIYSNERGMNYLFDQAGFGELSTALRREIDAGNLRPEQLNKVSIGDAVRLAHAQRLADEAALAKDLPKVMELPEGYSWQELTNEDPEVLRKILKREGEVMQNCIGGYCEDVTDEGTRLFTLRDPAGNPHVNIEVRNPRGKVVKELVEEGHDLEVLNTMTNDELLDLYELNFPKGAALLRAQEGYMDPIIKQIKGKQNEPPIAEYIPYVQQFIKEQGPFTEIRDLGNAGLIDLARARKEGVFVEDIPGLTRELNRIFPAETNRYGGSVLSGQYGVRISPDQMTREVLRNMEGNYTSTPELIEYLRTIEPRPVEQGYSKYWNEKPTEGFAEGGEVDTDEDEDEGFDLDLDLDDLDDQYEFIQQDEGYAEGGIVDKIARTGRKVQYKLADLVGLRPEVEFATEIPERYYPANEQHNARGDAMRHMLLQAQLYQKYGERPAKVIGWLHENLSGPQGEAEKAMDEYNDRLGREIGRAAKDKADMTYRALQAIEKKQAKTLSEREMAEGYADGGLVYNEDYDYDSMFEFK